MNLPQVIDLAIANNQHLIATQKRKLAADGEVTTARTFANPSFIAQDTRSKPNYLIGAGYNFEIGGQRGNRIEIAKSEAEIAGIEYLSELASLRRDVRLAFYKVLQVQERQKQLSASSELAQRLADISQTRFETGDVPRLDVLQAQLESKRRQIELVQAQGLEKSAKADLNALMGRDPQSDLQISGYVESEPKNLDLQNLIATGLKQRFEMRSSEQEVRAEKGRLALAKSERIPNLDVQGGTEIHDDTFQYGWMAGLTMDIPLFDRKQGEIARATSTIDSLLADQAALKIQIQAEIVSAYYRYQSAATQVSGYRSGILTAADELEAMSEDSYHEGKTGILSVIDSQRNVRQVRLEYLDALLDYQAALADLEKASGMELP
ncbi:MAG TPA: TolC family protein [Acidobacteriota bacterium]|nr:TolC family protein [Acidobacteriota bacterium]